MDHPLDSLKVSIIKEITGSEEYTLFNIIFRNREEEKCPICPYRLTIKNTENIPVFWKGFEKGILAVFSTIFADFRGADATFKYDQKEKI